MFPYVCKWSNGLIFIVKSRKEKYMQGNDKGDVFEAHVYKAYHCLSLKQFSHFTRAVSYPFTVPAVVLGDWFIKHIGIGSISFLPSYFCECSVVLFKIYLEFTVVLAQASCDVLS